MFIRAVAIQHWEAKALWPSNAKWPKRAFGAAQIRDRSTPADLCAPLLRRSDLAQGNILLRLDRKVLTDRLGVAPDRIESAARRISASFQMQRRCVEARIILGAAVPQVDPVLVKNILTAQKWYAAIKAGASFGDRATREKTRRGRA